jgi:hypothetical protein
MLLAVRRLALLLALVLAACAPPGPPFASVAATLPPVPPDAARIYFYRLLEPYETLAQATVYLNDRPVATSEIGAAFYRDVAPGQYVIRVRSFQRYPNDTATVVLAPGQVFFARIDSHKGWTTGGYNESGCFEAFAVVIVDPSVARDEMAELRFIPG